MAGLAVPGFRVEMLAYAAAGGPGRWSAQSRATSFPVTQSVLARADELIQ